MSTDAENRLPDKVEGQPACGHPVGVDNGNETEPCTLPKGHEGTLHSVNGAVGY